MTKVNSTLCESALSSAKNEFGFNNLSASHMRSGSKGRRDWDDNGQEKKWVNFYSQEEKITINSEIQIMNMQESPKAEPILK